MANLQLSFSDIYGRVCEFVGWGSSPSDANVVKAKAIVCRAYRQFLYPINRKTGHPHTWSFLHKHGKFLTESGKWEYQLPVDFANQMFWFEHDESTSYPPITFEAYRKLLRMRVLSSGSSYPTRFSIRTANYDQVIGQQYEVCFYETPNATYVLPFCYVFTPLKLSNATDIPIGGILACEALLETSLAVAETQEEEKIGIHTQLSIQLTQDLINNDMALVPDTVGYNLDRHGIYVYERSLPLAESDVVYYGE